tara:strand:+ start:9909 stop:11450 length:1542 start_codon:yes stop_codon:yes gene_type:complete
MSTINQPRVTVNLSNAAQTVQNTGQRVLIVGQMTSAGTATSGALNEQLDNNETYDTLFGPTSQLAGMCRAFKLVNEATRVDAIGLSDGAGTAATLIFTITGPATEDGTLTFTVGSDRNYSFTIAVSNTDTATVIGDALVAATASATNMPYTAANVAGVVTFTAENLGTVANNEAAQVSGSVAGVAVALSATDGATDPTLTNVFDVIGTERYQGIVWPYADTAALTTLLDARFNVTGKVLDGVGFVPFVGTQAEVLAQTTENSQSVVYLSDDNQANTDLIGASQVEIPYVVAAMFAGIRALRMDSSGQSISNFVSTTYGSLDGFGGPALASKPYFNTPLNNVNTNGIGLGYDDAEIETILAGGSSTYGNNVAGTSVIAGEIVTTYLTDSGGNTDETFKFLNYVDTASQVREYFFNNLRARFGQSRLTDGDTQPGRDMANAQVIQSFCKRLFQDLTGIDFVLLEAGEEALQFFIDNLIIAIDTQTGTATIQMTVPLVTQLRTLNADIKIAFSTTS